MGITLNGNLGVIQEVDSYHSGIHVIQRPTNVGSIGGAYLASINTGTISAGLAASSPIFSFRWNDSSKVCVVRDVYAGLQSQVSFTAGNGLFEMYIARSFTTGLRDGTVAALTGSSNKLKTSMPTSNVADMRVSSTGSLNPGTRTLDANPMATLNFTITTNATSSQLNGLTPVFAPDDNEWPLVLSANEGFVINATVPGTGTWVGYLQIRWEELSSFP